MNWTQILRKGGVSDPPGYRETVEQIKQRPYLKPRKKSKSKNKKGR